MNFGVGVKNNFVTTLPNRELVFELMIDRSTQIHNTLGRLIQGQIRVLNQKHFKLVPTLVNYKSLGRRLVKFVKVFEGRSNDKSARAYSECLGQI
jgi:hypothetical protein